MIRYVYDGSFEGFLCAASAALKDAGSPAARAESMPARPPACSARERAERLLRDVTVSALDADDADLFSEARMVVTNLEEAARFGERIRSAAGAEELDAMLFAHASGDPSTPRLLFSYAAMTLAAGKALRDDIADPVILAVRRIQDRVSKEINRLMGFVRFRKVAEGFYYAAVSPDSNVVGFLGPHFSDRFPDMAFLIHDVSRSLAWRHDPARGSGVILLPELPEDLKESLASESEALIPALWKEYFRRIAIPERRNPGLQMKLMPRRYRKHMTEVEDRVTGREPDAKAR